MEFDCGQREECPFLVCVNQNDRAAEAVMQSLSLSSSGTHRRNLGCR